MIELSIIIPTRNEKQNIEPLISAIDSALQDVVWEAIFVDDDSTDGTIETVRELACRDTRIRGIHRIGRRGLSSACIEGMLSSSAPYLAVIDADLQHDEKLLSSMLHSLKTTDVDIVVGSRYMKGGGTGEWQKSRAQISQVATWLSRILLKVELSDPMSGFFSLKRSFLERTVRNLSGKGFKILLDLFMSAKGKVKFLELPYTFKKRERGESKLDTMVAWEFCLLLFEKLFGKFIPVRFLMFTTVGCAGAMLHLLLLGLLVRILNAPFSVGQAVAALTAMGLNFVLNNVFTYRDQRLRGWSFLRGIIIFYLACAIGAIINVRIAYFLYNLSSPWWFAGLIGAMIGAVWNYSISSIFAWKRT